MDKRETKVVPAETIADVSETTAGPAIIGRLREMGRHTFLDLFAWAKKELGGDGDHDDELRRRLRGSLDALVKQDQILRAIDGTGRPVYSAPVEKRLAAQELDADGKRVPMCGACGKPGHGWCDDGPAAAAPAPKLRSLPPVPTETTTMPKKPQSDSMNAKEAAKFLGCSVSSICLYRKAGKLTGTGFPATFSKSQLLALVAARKAGEPITPSSTRKAPTPAKSRAAAPDKAAAFEPKTAQKRRAVTDAQDQLIPVDVFMDKVRLLAEPWAQRLLSGDAFLTSIKGIIDQVE